MKTAAIADPAAGLHIRPALAADVPAIIALDEEFSF
jgi:hypothetical protein